MPQRWCATVALALCLGGCLDGGPGRRSPLGEGDAVPPAVLAENGPALVWTFRSADCLTCKLANPAWVVRRLQTRSGDGLETVVVAVGKNTENERALVEGFLASERISARIALRTPRGYGREFGPAPMPALYAVDPTGAVLTAVPSPDVGPVVFDWETVDVDAVLQALRDALKAYQDYEDPKPSETQPNPKENAR